MKWGLDIFKNNSEFKIYWSIIIIGISENMGLSRFCKKYFE